MQCRHCGAPLRRGVGVCPACGTSQPRSVTTVRCRACGKRSLAALQVCPHCGRNLKPGLPISFQALGLGIVGVLAAVFLITRLNFDGAGQALTALAPTITLPTPTTTPTRPAPALPLKTPTDAAPVEGQDATPTTAAEMLTVTVTEALTPTASAPPVTLTSIASATPTATAMPTATPTATAMPTATPTATSMPTATPTATPMPTATTVATPTRTPTKLSPTKTPTATPRPTEVNTPAGTVRYTIRAGDTLSLIAQRFNTTVASLLALNPGLNPSRLRVGAVILVAGSPADANATPTPPPTSTAAVQMDAPVLVGPATGSSYNGEDAIILLNWQSPGALADSIAYLLEIGYRIGGNFDWRSSEVTTTTGWRVSNQLYGKAEQETGRRYSWRVTMVSVTVDSSGRITALQRVSPASETREFLWN